MTAKVNMKYMHIGGREILKGDITLSAVFEGLLVIGVAAYLYFLLVYSKVLIVSNLEEDSRLRSAVNFVNGLISHEKIAYEKNGVLYRGVLDERKLNLIFYQSTSGFRNEEEYANVILNPDFMGGKISREEINLGYAQFMNVIYIIDAEDCSENRCLIWGGNLLPIPSLNDLTRDSPIYKYLKCVYEVFSRNWPNYAAGCAGGAMAGGGVGFFVFGPIGAAVGAAIGCVGGLLITHFTSVEQQNCMKYAAGDIKKLYVTTIMMDDAGLPINIVREDGTVHVGRILVGIVEGRSKVSRDYVGIRGIDIKR